MNEQIYPGMQGVSPVYMQRRRFSNSRLWYAAVIPLLSLLIEVYAANFVLGALVWSCCVISWTAACLLDRKYLAQNGVDVSGLSPVTAVLPPVYIFRRVRLTGDQNTTALVFVCLAFYAACANGFVRGITMDQDRMISQIKDNYWSNISNVADCDNADTAGLIGDSIDDLPETLGAEGEAEWSAKRIDDRILVTVQRGDFALRFEARFDGYAFTNLKAIYYSDGLHEAEYDDDSDNTVFKKYFSSMFDHMSEKTDNSRDDDGMEGGESSSDIKAEENAGE